MAAFERYQTGQQIVTLVMQRLGLTPPNAIASATDQTAKQFWTLLTDVGQELLGATDWQVLQSEHHVTTTPGVQFYDFPPDLHSYVNDASWNRTTRLPVTGPLAEFEWQMLKARLLAGTSISVLYRIENNTIVLYDTPTSAQELIFPYKSRGWVEAADGTRQDHVIQDDDVVLLDSYMMRIHLRKAWMAEKGFDTTKVELDAARALNRAIAADLPKRTLSLVPNQGYPLLGQLNLPDTNYGL